MNCRFTCSMRVRANTILSDAAAICFKCIHGFEHFVLLLKCLCFEEEKNQSYDTISVFASRNIIS